MLLVSGRSVLTGRIDIPEVRGGGVVVDGSTIVAVGHRADLRRSFPGAREIGGPDSIVMPGLISAHQHGGGVTSVQLGCLDRPFEQWLLAMLGLVPLDIRLDTTFHALRLLENGVTTTLHSHYSRDPAGYADEVDAILAGYADVGMRVAFAPCFMDRNLLTYGEDEAFLASLPPRLAAHARAVRGAGISAPDYVPFVSDLSRTRTSDKCSILFGPVAPQWCSLPMLAAIGSAVEGGIAGIHTHLLETPAQRAYLDRSLGRSIVTVLDELGLLGRSTSVAHGLYLTASETELIAARGTSVVANPGSNLRLGNGQVPLSTLLSAGVNVAVGTDDMTLGDDDDLLSEVRLLRSLARPHGLWPEAAVWLHAATGAGARAIGMDNLVGSLEIGKQADIAILDARRIREPYSKASLSDLELVLTRARGDDVETVLVGGDIVLEGRRHRSIDRDALTTAIGQVGRVQQRDPRFRAFSTAMLRVAERYRSGPPPSVTGG